MSFVWPQYLWLLLLVPVLVAAYVAVLRRKKVGGPLRRSRPGQGGDRPGAALPPPRAAAAVPAGADRAC